MTKNLKILHLEDNERDAFFIRNVLEQNQPGIEIILATSELEFISAMEQKDLDIILSDSGVPGFNSTRALELARKHRPQTPFIFVSGSLDEERHAAHLKAGAVDFVPKNQLWQLMAVIRRHVADGKPEQTD